MNENIEEDTVAEGNPSNPKKLLNKLESAEVKAADLETYY